MTHRHSPGRAADILSRVRRPAFLQAFLVLALLTTIVAGGYLVLEKVRAMRSLVNENTTWNVSRLETEHQVFMLAVLRTVPPADRDRATFLATVGRTFDIYYSRVDTVVSFVRERSLDTRSPDALVEQLDTIIAYRAEMAELVDRSQDDTALLAELAERAGAMAPAHRKLAIDVLQTNIRITQEDRERDERGLWTLVGLFGLLMVLLGSLVIILIGMNGRLNGHVARARAARDRLQGIINVAPAAILLTDAQGQIRELNNVAADLLGMSRSAAQGRPVGDFIDQLKAFGQPDVPEEEGRRLKLRTNEGRRIPVEVASTPIAAIAPELDRLIALRDMSDYVRLEANLDRAQLEAHFHATERSRFAADWNHRLRTPVQTILSVLDLCAVNVENPNVKAGVASALAAARDIMNGLEGTDTSHDDPPVEDDASLVAPAPQAVLRQFHILVVEDHDQNRALLCDLVGSLGHRAVAAATGEEAVARAEEVDFDLILMDIGLPGIDGVEASRLIRESEKGAHRAAICAVSAHSRMLDAPRLLAAGMDQVMLKPLRRAALAQLIAGVAAPARDLPEPNSALARDALDELVEQIGADRVVELFEGLFLEAQSAIDAARAWLAHGDPATALNEAHRTAGLAGLVGAQELLGALSTIEASAARDDRASGVEAVQRCVEALAATRHAWERFD